jgi:ADP-heptose:LPS heptosyltransferase
MALICLGRAGDLLNALGVASVYRRRGYSVTILTTPEFASIVEASDFALQTIPVDRLSHGLGQAIHMAEEKFDVIRIAQAHGKKHGGREPRRNPLEKHWDQEAFVRAGLTAFHHHAEPPSPLFPNVEESDQIFKHFKVTPSTPYIVTCFEGKSSPLPADSRLRLTSMFMDVRGVVNLDGFRCRSVVDLLPLLEHAVGLITVDTSILHLSRWTETPTLALVNEGWLGTATRPHWIARIPYTTFVQQEDVL